MTGDAVRFCPNGHMMEEHDVDYMFGEYGGLQRAYRGVGAPPDWVKDNFAKLAEAKIAVTPFWET